MFWNIKTCRKCGRSLPETDVYFRVCADAANGLYPRCRICVSAHGRAKYIANLGARRIYDAAYRLANADKVKAGIKRWHENNREYVAAYRKKKLQENRPIRALKQKARYASDPQFREKVKLLRRLDHALRGTSVRSPATAELLGCSQSFLRSHLEALFSDGMSWGNRGKGKVGWQVDHIVPCHNFDLTDEAQRRACFHYTNLRPLWSVDNLKKGVRDERTKSDPS